VKKPEVIGAAFLTEKGVLALVPVNRMTLRRIVAAGQFPAPRQLSPGRIGWLTTEVEAWIAATPVARSAARGIAA
jgi:predicted DNA-binding transcriptional regulator AlpA